MVLALRFQNHGSSNQLEIERTRQLPRCFSRVFAKIGAILMRLHLEVFEENANWTTWLIQLEDSAWFLSASWPFWQLHWHQLKQKGALLLALIKWLVISAKLLPSKKRSRLELFVSDKTPLEAFVAGAYHGAEIWLQQHKHFSNSEFHSIWLVSGDHYHCFAAHK